MVCAIVFDFAQQATKTRQKQAIELLHWWMEKCVRNRIDGKKITVACFPFKIVACDAIPRSQPETSK